MQVASRTAANDNTPAVRPADFDDRVMAYMPGLKRLALKKVPRIYADDLVTDTIICALEKWENYREEGGMWNWLVWQMRGIISNSAIKAKARSAHAIFVPLDDHDTAVAANQNDYVELSMTLDRISGRDGGILLRRAMGYGLREIAEAEGVGSERVRQLEERARKRLEEAA